ncbi:receptor-like protein 6 [Helianthus annuus]|uniref:receptor-like protein 6 n=1 Tax=Helianthus annuus TaxID=4232 RepID=UPI001652C31F|nr:receptor-like protein 6 [Helianthus annuus]
MTSLEFLDLSGDDISSSVPRFLANFSSLRHIKLRDCQLRDEFPSAVFHLPKLKHLSMGNNSNLTGFLPEFHNTSLLEKLYLFSTGFAGIIPESISNLNHLKVLSLQSCHFSGHIPGSLPNLTQLTYLGLSKNELAGLVPSLVSLSKLTILDLAYNKFEKGSMYGWINKLTNLNELYLDSYNKFNGTVGLDSFSGLNKLETLSIDQNSLSFVTTSNYTNATLPELLVLGLSSCNLKEFPAFLRFQTKMEALALRYNEIEGLVPTWIWNNSQETLQMIDLANNFITGFDQHPQFLPWVCLEFFDMSYNKLQGRLPMSPQTIVAYDVSNNYLNGEIPPWICELKFLQFLDLSSNQMTRTLPSCFGNLYNSLSVLDLKQYSFHGPMMNTCTQGSPLKKIDLSKNQFSGQVSKSLADCIKLEFLSLAANSFEDVFSALVGNSSQPTSAHFEVQ